MGEMRGFDKEEREREWVTCTGHVISPREIIEEDECGLLDVLLSTNH